MKNSYSLSYYENPNNPYDDVGQIHNDCIEYYNANRTYLGNNLDSLKFDIADVTSDYMVTINPENIQVDIKDYYFNEAYKGFTDFSDYNPQQRVTDVLESSESQTLFNELVTIFGNVEDSDEFLQQLIDDIIVWEDEVISSPNISLNDQKVLLSISSILRHSGFLWNQHYNDPDSFIHDWNANNIPLELKDKKVVMCWFWDDAIEWLSKNYQELTACAVSDGMGFVYGGPVGGASASIFTAVYIYLTN